MQKTEKNVEVGEKNEETQKENVEARNENIEARKWVLFDVKGDLFAVWMRKKSFIFVTRDDAINKCYFVL